MTGHHQTIWFNIAIHHPLIRHRERSVGSINLHSCKQLRRRKSRAIVCRSDSNSGQFFSGADKCAMTKFVPHNILTSAKQDCLTVEIRNSCDIAF